MSAESEKGGQRKTADLNLNVLSCYSTGLSLDAESDSLCPGTEAQHEILLTNAGNFAETYALTISGTEWASLSASSVRLEAAESKNIDLILSPTIDISKGDYNVVVTAKAQSTSGTTDSISLDVSVLGKDACFAVDIVSEIKTTEVEFGGSSLVPITVENLGVQKVKYTLDISGNGAAYAQLNPSALEVEGGKSEKTYLYISAPDGAEEKSYSLVISARDEDGVVSSSSTFTFDVVEEAEVVEPSEAVNITLPEFNITGLLPLAAIKDKLKEIPYVAESYDYLREHWYLGIAIIVIIVLIIAGVIGKLTGGEEDEFLDDFDEKPKKKEKKGLWKRFTGWLEAEDMEEFEVGWEPEKKKKPVKKEKGAWQKFMDWLEEEEPVKKPEKKKGKGVWDSFSNWLEKEPEEEPKEKPKPKAKPKKGKGVWDKFLGWLEEDTSEQAPRASSKAKGESPKKKVKKKKGKKGSWDKFMDWLEED